MKTIELTDDELRLVTNAVHAYEARGARRGVICRILLWGLADARTTLDELRARIDGLEPLPPPSTWLTNDAAERFGVVLFAEDADEELPLAVAEVRTLIGREPDAYEEFDTLE